MGQISLPDFFKYFKGTRNQLEAVVLLEKAMPASLLQNDSTWVELYRTPDDPPEDFHPGSPFSHKITEHFTYGEMCNGEEARRFTNQGQCDIALSLCLFLEKARCQFGQIKISSGHRPPAINQSIGGAAQSEHLFQEGCGAVDAYPVNGCCKEFQDWVDQNWPYSVGYGADYRGFVHIGRRAGNPRVRWDY